MIGYCLKMSPWPVRLFLAALGAAAAGSGSAHAELLPIPQEIALPAERDALDALEALIANAPAPGLRLQAFDAALPRLREPTKLRGLVQFARAELLQATDNRAEAQVAVEESIRLLPGYSGPLLLAGELFTYSEHPERAADYLIRASHIDPEAVREISSYEISALIGRLSDRKDVITSGRLSERLLQINWLGDDLDTRSFLVRTAIDARTAAGDVEAAKLLVQKLIDPAHARDLLIQNRFRALWPELERWAGSNGEKLWPLYLAELRARWVSTRKAEAAVRYAAGLHSAGHHQTVIDEMLPLYAGKIDAEKDYELIFLASHLAESLARKGPWDAITKMYDAALAVWPLGSDANAINLASNRARYLHYRGDAAAAAALFDQVLADAVRRPGDVTARDIATIHSNRACALHELGRGREAAASRQVVLAYGSPSLTAATELCMERPEAARDALLAGLRREGSRGIVLSFVQRGETMPMDSDYGRRIFARREALRSDPRLLEEVRKYGRVLPPLSSGAPPEQLAGAKRPI